MTPDERRERELLDKLAGLAGQRVTEEGVIRDASRLSRKGLCRVRPVHRWAAEIELTAAGWALLRGQS
ncbi:hypothetical protein SAMN06265365_1883 [Tistlia consotensis]|uniref:hypothetical protein n=1 Tax=Tistlia consotensis TaxID=1321365 RepID=UPI000B666E76|nr:hypothetical protein [Tistlia consotensis]SNS43848.1 hypothetical protein SAMN06265365_1883 [Tistlia consotensis]